MSFEDVETELKMVHLIFRHGDRTPDHTYPNDPHKDHSYAPYSAGDLTKAGYKKMFNNGKIFRDRYDSFLGSLYKQNEVYVRSTGMARTRMSLQLFCAGLFPPANTDLEWKEDLNWQPVDFVSQPMTEDPLLFSMGAHFQTFVEELAMVYEPVIQKNKELFDTLERFTGKPIRQPFDVTNLYQTMTSQVEHGLELPEWAEPFYPQKLLELSTEAFSVMVATDALKKTIGGNLLESMIVDWEAKVAGTSSKKIFLYSGHDTTVIGALGACNVWNPSNFPEYGMTAIFELRQNKRTGEHGVQIYVKKDPESEPSLLTIPGCNSFCVLSDMKTTLSNNVPTTKE